MASAGKARPFEGWCIFLACRQCAEQGLWCIRESPRQVAGHHTLSTARSSPRPPARPLLQAMPPPCSSPRPASAPPCLSLPTRVPPPRCPSLPHPGSAPAVPLPAPPPWPRPRRAALCPGPALGVPFLPQPRLRPRQAPPGAF